MSERRYVPQGVFLTCDKGATPSTLRISQQDTDLYAVPLATEADKIPFLNVKPFGPCKAKGGFQLCIPIPIVWLDPEDGITRGGFRLLTDESTLRCTLGGKIEIHYTQAAANAVTWGGNLRRPTEYISSGFDWLYDRAEEDREQRDSWLPGWMQPVTDVVDWTADLGLGLAEGAVNGIVGLGETAYQIYQDPVGTAEALGGMIQDGWNAGAEGVGNAWDWASEGGNWTNAAEGAWDWASDGDNWVEAGQNAWDAAGDAANWVAENPRSIGNVVGEFIPDAAAAVYSGGTSLAASGARVAGREVAEEIVEEVLEEGLERAARGALEEVSEEAAERIAREAGEEAAEAGAREIGEEVAEEIPEVVARRTIQRITSHPFRANPNHDYDEFLRQLQGQQDGLNNLTVDEFIRNRDEYLANGRSAEGARTQREFRERALQEKIDEFEDSGLSLDDATAQAEEWMSTRAALHDPDQIAGGFGTNVTGMGDSRVNSSIGAQWNNKVDDIDRQVREAAENMTEAERQSTYLNIELSVGN